MEAKYDGWCDACRIDIHVGDEIVSNDDGAWVHRECGPEEYGPDDGDIMGRLMGTVDYGRDAEEIRDDLAECRELVRRAAGYVPDPVDPESAAPPPSNPAGQVVLPGGDLVRPGSGILNPEAISSTGALRVTRVPLPTVPPQPEVKRDRYGRYVLKHPTKNLRGALSRCTTVVKASADTYALGEWQKGNVARGLSRRPDLLAMAASMGPGDRRLKKLVKDAEEAGGGSEAANLGTALHGFTEAVDRGGRLADVPEDYRDDVIAYRKEVIRQRLTVVPEAIERVTMTSRWDGVAGTFDRIYRLDDGTYVIGDVKSGKVGYDPKEMFAQLAVYAEGVNEVGVYDVAEERWERLPFEVRTDLGLIVHLPAGEATCTVYLADLEAGRHHVEFCASVRRHRKLKHPLPAREAPDLTEDEWFDALCRATSRDALAVLGWMINDDGAMTDRLLEAGRTRAGQLPA